MRKVITAQEDERKRIARELHDETTQSLAVLAMGLEAAQDAIRGGLTPRLDEVKAVAVRTLEDVHRLILDLRPSVLDDLGLFSAIRYAQRSLETRHLGPLRIRRARLAAAAWSSRRRSSGCARRR